VTGADRNTVDGIEIFELLGLAGIEEASPLNAECGRWLTHYLDGRSRLLVSDVEFLLGDLPLPGVDSRARVTRGSRLHRYLAARAHNSERGRKLGRKTIEIREEILALQDGYEQMTVRQIFYQLVARGVVPKTEAQGYVPVQKQVLALRRQHFLPWGFVADGTRWRRRAKTWDSTEDALRETARTYRRNLWRSQGVRIEVWLEKDALASVINPTTYAFGVDLMVSRGQSSDTYCYDAAEEARTAWEAAEIETVVYTLYDFDKSGRVAAEKIEEKIRDYSDGAPIDVVPLALTARQIEEWSLPTRPAKEEGEPDAVELDAIPPDKLKGLVEDAIVSHIDADAWKKEQAVEESEREILERLTTVGGEA
jgi:hypothetical protein